MKYIDALKKYNEGKDRWCTPRKGSVDYLKIRKMMKEIKASSSASAAASASSPKKASSSIPAPPKKVSPKTTLYKKANLIQRFLKNKLILSKNNIDTRVQRYNLIRKRLDVIKSNECLTRKMFGNKEGYTVNEIVNLE